MDVGVDEAGCDYEATDIQGGRGIRGFEALPCPGDVDADGTVGILDFLALLASWGPCAGCAADLDDDGIVGIVDFLALLAAWGPCP